MMDILQKILTPSGITINGPHPYDIQIHNKSFIQKLPHNVSLVAGESYMEGMWDCQQLDELFFRITRHINESLLSHRTLRYLSIVINTFFNWQTKQRAQQVAEQHYNIGNELYEYMLGNSMAYTCAYWDQAMSLDQAQNNKHELVCKKLGIKSSDRVLDLGCGFGGFAKYAAEHYGCEVVAVNIAQAQIAYAKRWCKDLPITFHQTDYRDHHIYNSKQKCFDKIVSIGLCEHVGIKNYPTFIQIVRQQLKDDGLFLLHTIGKNYSENSLDTWIDRYIFPNGMLPSLQQLCASFENQFVVEDLHNFGADYDPTLMAWHDNFNKQWPELKEQYSERFYRMWNYYLLSCAGTFRARAMQLWQFVLSPKGIIGGYQRVSK